MSPKARTIRVLVVDDDPAVLATLGRTFAIRASIQVVGSASDGAEAVQLAQRVPADVIVMDERMPHMSGLEAIRRIREAGIDTPVLMFTADDSVPKKIRGRKDIRVVPKGHGGFGALRDAVESAARPGPKRGRSKPVRPRGK
jgi:DNA-binding NarL/FixJ family response regulator